MDPIDTLMQALLHAPALLVSVEAARGSAPREAGAWMAVFADSVVNTIGGGQLEFQAIAQARQRLAGAALDGSSAATSTLRYPLGPALGQCCGGVVWLRYQPITAAQAPALRQRLLAQRAATLQPVALFGAGHVGQALVRLLLRLPYQITWIDSRAQIFPEPTEAGVVCEQSDPLAAAVPDLAAGSRVLIMSFSHAEDLAVVAACLQRCRDHDDLPFIGLIGSRSKWATFQRHLRERGFGSDELARVSCPIGIPGIKGKQPEVIALAVAAQLLLQTSGR